jgi:hypothetical protein
VRPESAAPKAGARAAPPGTPPDGPRAASNAPLRLLAMALWVPRILVFALRLPRRVAARPLPELLEELTPRRVGAWPTLTPPELARVVWNVLRFRSGPLNHGCFVRSFTRYHYLRRLGHPVVFHLGVEERPGGAEPPRSHAWLTLDGVPFLEVDPGPIAASRRIFTWPKEEA